MHHMRPFQRRTARPSPPTCCSHAKWLYTLSTLAPTTWVMSPHSPESAAWSVRTLGDVNMEEGYHLGVNLTKLLDAVAEGNNLAGTHKCEVRLQRGDISQSLRAPHRAHNSTDGGIKLEGREGCVPGRRKAPSTSLQVAATPPQLACCNARSHQVLLALLPQSMDARIQQREAQHTVVVLQGNCFDLAVHNGLPRPCRRRPPDGRASRHICCYRHSRHTE